MNELRLGRSVELPSTRISLRLTFHGRDHAVEHTRLSGALDGRNARADVVHDLLVREPRVREQDDPSPFYAVRGNPPVRQHRLETRTFVGRELHSISLHTGRARRFAHEWASFHPSASG